MILSDAGADAMLTGTFSTSLNTGYFRLYSGTVPTSTSAGAGTLIAGDIGFGATAFGAAAASASPLGRKITANAMTGDTAADAAGTPTYGRAFKSDGTTVMFQCTVGAVGSGAEAEVDTLPIVLNAPVNVTSLVVTLSTT